MALAEDPLVLGPTELLFPIKVTAGDSFPPKTVSTLLFSILEDVAHAPLQTGEPP